MPSDYLFLSDANGNLTTCAENGTTYTQTWDNENRLAVVTALVGVYNETLLRPSSQEGLCFQVRFVRFKLAGTAQHDQADCAHNHQSAGHEHDQAQGGRAVVTAAGRR